MLKRISTFLLLLAFCCGAPGPGNQNDWTIFYQNAQAASLVIDLHGLSYNGGFIVQHDFGPDKLSTIGGNFSGKYPELYSTAHFLVDKTEAGYKVHAFGRVGQPQYVTSAAIHIMMFYNGGYLKIPVQSKKLAQYHKMYKEFQLGDASLPRDSIENLGCDLIQVNLAPDSIATDPYEMECASTSDCQDSINLEYFELDIPLNLLNIMIYQRYTEEMSQQLAANDHAGRAAFIAKYRADILSALDHAAELSKLPSDPLMSKWLDMQKSIVSNREKSGLFFHYWSVEECKESSTASPLCDAKVGAAFDRIFNEGLFTVDNGLCEQINLPDFMQQIKSRTTHRLRTCAGVEIGEFLFDASTYTNDGDLYHDYIIAENERYAQSLKQLLAEILATKPSIYASMNYVYEPTKNEEGNPKPELHKLFCYEFDITKPAVYSIRDGEGLHGPVDFFQYHIYEGLGDLTTIYTKVKPPPFEQFSLDRQLGAIYKVNGWPLHLIGMRSRHDSGGQIIPPPPLPDLEDASRAAAPAAAPQASADPAPNPTSATPNNVTPPAQTQPDPTPIAGGPTTPAPVVDPVLTPNPAPPATQPVPSPTPSPAGTTAPVLVDEPIATPPSTDPGGAIPGDAVASQAPAADNSATNPNAAPGPAPIIIGQATSEPGSIGGLGSRGDQLDPAAQSDFGCD